MILGAAVSLFSRTQFGGLVGALSLLLLTATLACGGSPDADAKPEQACNVNTRVPGQPPTATAADAARMSRIAYASDQGGNWDIWVMNADGSNPQNITNSPSLESYPSWSPDGKEIVFHSDRDGNLELYVMNADGSDVRRLTTDPGRDHSPAWSPNGERIAWVSDRKGKDSIWVMEADGSGACDVAGSLFIARWPTWDPDSRKVAYEGDASVWISWVDDLTKGERIIKSEGFFDGMFSGWLDWAPDGRRLALVSNHQERNEFVRNLYTSELDGFRFRRVFNEPTGSAQERPSWSSDSRLIAYGMETVDGGNWDILIVGFETGETYRLTSGPSNEAYPDWEPVGYVPVFGSE